MMMFTKQSQQQITFVHMCHVIYLILRSWETSKVHLKSRGTDCKMGDNFLNLRGIVNLSLGIPSSHKELNF